MADRGVLHAWQRQDDGADRTISNHAREGRAEDARADLGLYHCLMKGASMTTLYLIRHALRPRQRLSSHRRLGTIRSSPNGLLQMRRRSAAALNRKVQIDACYAMTSIAPKTASGHLCPESTRAAHRPAPAQVGLSAAGGKPSLRRAGQFRAGAAEQFNHDTIRTVSVEGSERRGHSLPRVLRRRCAVTTAAGCRQTVAVFTHGSVLRAFQQRLLGNRECAVL